MKKHIFSLVLALCMVVSLMPAVAAAGYHDTDDHWAEEAIARWSEHGIVEGNDGWFSPDGELSRGQLAAIIARLLKLPAAPDAGFGDTDGHWAEDVINRCYAAGIMLGDGVNANPDKPISREETMVMLGRALGIKPVENADLSHYDDDHAVSDWAEGYVAAMTGAGIVNGIDGNLAPAAEIDRASTMTILDRAITTYVTEPGATVESTGGIVVVAAEDVTVTGEAEAVVVTQGAAGGTTTLENVNVGTVTVQAEESSVVMGENAAAVEVTVTESAAGTNLEVTKDAAVGTVTTAAAESTVTVSGTVTNVTVSDTAANTTVEAEKGATITTVENKAENTTVTGSGTVENVTTSGDNTTVDTSGTKVEAAEGTTGTTAGGETVTGGESAATTPTTPSTPSTPSVPEHYCVVVSSVVTAPTCTERGYTTHTTCCGYSFVDSYVDANGHVNAYERNCTTPKPMGCKEMYCPDCDTILSTTTCTDFVVTAAPTCTEAGKKTCTVCGSVYNDEPALGHEDGVYCEACQKAYVSSADKLVECLEDGEDVVLMNDVKIDPANMSNAYGTTGINIKNGQTIDGGNNTLDIKGADGTWDSGINTTGGLIKNITVTGPFRGIFVNHNSTHSETVVLENVIIDGTVYTISCDQGMNQNLEATGCTFNGWTSYAATLGKAKFTDCSFGEGSGYAYCRPYAPTEFIGCEFEAGYEMDPRAAVTFENCTIAGVALTAENLATLVTSNIANATVK